MSNTNTFADVTLLITHYNRSTLLETLLYTLRDLEMNFGEVVVSDDASEDRHLQKLLALHREFDFNLVCSPANMGLSNNINKGQCHVTKPFTLYLQEDFAPTALFPERLHCALDLLNSDEYDIARFYAYRKPPLLKPVRDGFSEIQFHFWHSGYWKFWSYSDHPHLRRSDFLQKFGHFQEGIKSDEAEFRMMMSFLCQGGRGIIYDDIGGLFEHRHTANEGSTMSRNFWRSSSSPAIHIVRECYRYAKYYSYYFYFSIINKLRQLTT